jgi:hypothetical protein
MTELREMDKDGSSERSRPDHGDVKVAHQSSTFYELSELSRRMLRTNVFLLIPSEAQVQTKGASTEAKVIYLSLVDSSESHGFFANHFVVIINGTYFAVSGHSKKTLSQLMKR